MNLDKYQQMVVDCNTNAVVSAGAGSGKTTVLAARFLRLIKEGRADVSEILTLTFTRKAAAEMYERIYKQLLKEQNNPECAEAIKKFDRSSISTLDSFCSTIARGCCSDFGIPSNFSTDEVAVKALAEETSLDFILANAENPFMKDFIFMNGFEKVWNNFFVEISGNYLSIGEPKDFTQMYNFQMESASKELLKTAKELEFLSNQICDIDSKLKAVIEASSKLKDFLDFGLEVEDAVIPEFDVKKLKSIRLKMSDLKLSKRLGRSESSEAEIYKNLVDEINTVKENIEVLCGTLENHEMIKGLFDLTSDFQDEIFKKKRASGLLGFNDVLTISVAGLKKNIDLRNYYKSLFKYIMIDEFQDNNLLQKELLYLLAEKSESETAGVPSVSELDSEKLFFVGDEKQSIYRFRGADVSVFKELSNEVNSAGGVALSLKNNYRSEPDLIKFFNNVFENVMREDGKSYQASFEPLEYRDAILSEGCRIHLLYKPYEAVLPEGAFSADESEAYAIAEYINASVGALDVTEDRKVRKAVFSDFCILLRSGTQQKNYEQVFRASGIPYTSQGVRSLFQEAVVNDIYNFLQICLYPMDRTASAAYLRSPFINLSDLSVIELLESEKAIFAEGQAECCKTELDKERYKVAKELFEEINSRIDREPLADLVRDIWYKSGYRYLILRDSSLHGYLEHYDYLYELAVKHDEEGGTAAAFLDLIRENLGDYKKINDLKPLGYSVGGVQIMSIHQSKGLEFPVVIVANMGNTGRNDTGSSEPSYVSEKYGLSFNLALLDEDDIKKTNYFYTEGKAENSAREEAELRRLLYVAMTRAENHLILSGCHGRQNRKTPGSLLNLTLGSLGWYEGADPLECEQLADYIAEIPDYFWKDTVRHQSSFADIEAVSELYKNSEPYCHKIIKNEFSATELNAHKNEEIQSDEAGETLSALSSEVEKVLTETSSETDFGTLCHLVIERCIKNHGISSEFLDVLKLDLRPIFKVFSDSDWPIIFSSASKLATDFFSSTLWKQASEAESIESELPFTATELVDGRKVYINGIMDLVLETPDKVHIIDFKTDKKIVPGEYDLQMNIYIEAAENIYEKPASCSLYYLRGGREIKVS